MKKNFLLIVCLCTVGVHFALSQDVILQGQTHRQIEKAQRIATQPEIDHIVRPQPVVEYPLLPIKYPIASHIDSIRPASIKIREQLDELYSTHLKLGIGSKMMPLGEIMYNNLRSRKFRYGGKLTHLSSLTNIPNYERSTFNRTTIGLYGELLNTNYQLGARYDYSLTGLHYYAIPAPIDSLGKDRTRQRYSNNNFNLHYKNRVNVVDIPIQYQLVADYNNLQTHKPSTDTLKDWYARENSMRLVGTGHTTIDATTYQLGVELLYNNYKYGNPTDTIKIVDTAIVLTNTILHLKPNITTHIWDSRFKTVVGMDIAVDAHRETKAYLYPNIKIDYALFNDVLIPYIGVRGYLKDKTLYALVQENEFLQPNIDLRNEHTSVDFYGGLKGSLSRNIGFHAGISYAYRKNVALFINDMVYSPGNRFNVLYDAIKHFTFEGSLSYQKNEKIQADITGKFHSYETRNQSYPWHKPNFEFITSLHYNLYDKVYAHLDFTLLTERKSLVYASDKDVYTENGQFFRKLTSIYDINLSVEYRYTRRISIFAQLNNIVGKRYQRWYNAPVHGLQVMAGLTFRL